MLVDLRVDEGKQGIQSGSLAELLQSAKLRSIFELVCFDQQASCFALKVNENGIVVFSVIS